MRLLYGHSAEVARWVGWRIPLTRKRLERDPAAPPFGPSQAIGVIDSAGLLVAGVVFHGWDPDCQSVELSFAADTPRWLTREVIAGMMGYAFDQIGANRLCTSTPKSNREARRFIERFGFRREGVATDGFGPGEHAIFSRMLKREWLETKWAKAATAPR